MFRFNNKQPYQMQPSTFGLLGGGLIGAQGMYNNKQPMQTGFGAPIFNQFSGGGSPSGYLPPPTGVPFARSPYTQFGSPFGLGLGFWNSGFGIGPQFPENLWTRPTQAQSPQSPVAPPPQTNTGNSGGSWNEFLDAYWRGRQNRGPGSETPLADPTYGQYQNWLSNPSATLMWR